MFGLRSGRPLYILGITVFFVTTFLVNIGEANGWYLALVAALGLAVLLCIPKLRRVGMVHLALFGVVLASLGTHLFYAYEVQPLASFDGQTLEITARVQSVEQEETTQYILKVNEDGDLQAGTRLVVIAEESLPLLQPYTTVQTTVSVYLPSSKSWYGDRIFLAGVLETAESVSAPQPTALERLSDTLCARFSESVDTVLSSEQAAFITGVCIGDTSDISADVLQMFRKSGLAHLVVVSGLHMTIVSGAIFALLKGLRMRRGRITGITLSVIWLFMLMVGFSVSVIRAAVMLHCLLLGMAVRRRADSRTSLAVAVLLLVLANPYTVCDVGFLLSFSATWGLIVLMPLWNRLFNTIGCIKKHRWLQNVLQPIGCSLAAMVFTAPICAKTFGSLAVLSPLSNVLTSWPITVLLPCAFLGGILFAVPFLQAPATLFLHLAGVLARWILWVARWVASLPFSQLQIRHPVWLYILLLLPFAVAIAAKLYGKRGVWRILVTNVVVAAVLVVAFSHVYRRYTFIRIADTGYSTVAVVQSETVTAAVISGEDVYAYEKAQWYFAAYGVEHLDVLVITDYGEKAQMALAALLATVPTGAVVCPAKEDINGVVLLEDNESFCCDMLTITPLDGWWRMDVGNTRVLFTARDRLVKSLPEEWQQVDLTVVRQSVPDDIEVLCTQHIAAVCYEKHLTAVKKQLTVVTCSVAVNRAAAYCTTGNGDMKANDRFWL